MGLMRIPYTDPLPAPHIVPGSANTLSGAVAAVSEFLGGRLLPAEGGRNGQLRARRSERRRTVLLTGAGISVASGLADYRGENGTYRLNKTYRPIYYHEFISNHEARKRYWARSFLGWPNLVNARPNAAHHAVRKLGELKVLSSVITQSMCNILASIYAVLTIPQDVDSFHHRAHPQLPTVELHGYLRSLVCLTCRNEYPRSTFQDELSRLNPRWEAFLQEMLASGALTTEDPEERRAKGLRTNPDGDVDVHGVDYSTFRYPACPVCLDDVKSGRLKLLKSGDRPRIELDGDGAWLPSSNAAILKPAVIMFGENISEVVKRAAESAIDEADGILVVGSSLATYSAWRLVKRAKDKGMRIGMINLGGVRGEENFFEGTPPGNSGAIAVRCSQKADVLLPEVVKVLEEIEGFGTRRKRAVLSV